MLVIKMQEDDMLVIGDDVRIYVRQVSGGGVKLCIDAPREVAITRLAAPRDAARSAHVDVVGEGRVDASDGAGLPAPGDGTPAPRARRAREPARRV